MALPSVRFDVTLTGLTKLLQARLFDGATEIGQIPIDVTDAYGIDLEDAFTAVLQAFELNDPLYTLDTTADADVLLADINAQIDGLSERLPPEFHEFYWTHMHGKPFAPLLIDEDDPFPWELVRPLRPTGRTLPVPILGQRFAMGRFAATPADETPIQTPALLAIGPEMPVCNPGLVCGNNIWRTHASAIAQAFPHSTILDKGTANRDRVIDELTDTKRRVIHFMGHSYLDPHDFNKSWLKLDGRSSDDGLNTEDVAGLAAGATESRDGIWPWVFVNACDSGATSGSRARTRQGTEWTFTGWGRAFGQAGARATIGPYWNVEKQAANRVASRFYEYVESGQSLGEALRSIRNLFFNSSDLLYRHPTLLAYTLHGDPTIRAEFVAEE